MKCMVSKNESDKRNITLSQNISQIPFKINGHINIDISNWSKVVHMDRKCGEYKGTSDFN